MNKYIISGCKWFDKINGNTYHSVIIIDVDSNKRLWQSPITYGYGEHWKTTAYDWLIKNNLALESDRHNHDLNRVRFIYLDNGYMPRKKDLQG